MKTLSLLPLAPLRAGLVALLLSLAPALPASPGAAAGTIRVIAGLMVPLTDETGARWLPSGDFPDGEAVDRPELRIANTDIPSVYRSERYGMTRFVRKIPNGNYVVKLHFAVTYEAIVGPGQCVFTFDVEGNVTRDFDLFVKAGGALKAHVESIPVMVSDGALDIRFTGQVGNPTISAVEIVPKP